MAFDPLHEDFMRIALANQQSSLKQNPYEQIRQVSAMTQQFSWGNAALATTDEDRAFHLMAQAAHMIDGKLPFVPMTEGAVMAEEAKSLLEEAISLDPACFDAQRMLHAQSSPTLESHVRYLTDMLPSVKRSCEKRAQQAQALQWASKESRIGTMEPRDQATEFDTQTVSYVTPQGHSGSQDVHSQDADAQDSHGRASSIPSSAEERAQLARLLELAPYLRWLQSLAELSLLSGRYTKALEYAKASIAADPHDPADSRLTAVLAFAKLEDAKGLSDFLGEVRDQLAEPLRGDAWLAITELALAWQNDALETARGWIGWLLHNYPMAATTLHEQVEFPEPVFARLNVEPHSEDELMIAVSEAAVLFQEGADESGRGPLGHFVARDPRVREAFRRERAFFERSGGEPSSSQDAAEGFDLS